MNMPTIFETKELPVTEKNGVKIATLANQTMLGTNALQVERIVLRPGGKSDPYPPSEAERFLYVIRGKGQVQVGQQLFPLEAESVLWLEKGDTFTLAADPEGLDVLLCHAPASK
jgi:quercetin dioxygenase-like cupin family protein